MAEHNGAITENVTNLLARLQAALAGLEGWSRTIEVVEATGDGWPDDGHEGRRRQNKLSPQGEDFIIQHETYGRKPALKLYLDGAGNPTIGYGHEEKQGEDFSGGITMAQARMLLDEDIQAAVNEVNAALQTSLKQNQFDALVDLVYNEGPKAVAPRHEMMRAINAGNVAEHNFTAWDLITIHDRQVVSRGLFKRRVEEWLLWEEGDY